MGFYNQLEARTAEDRLGVLQAPVVAAVQSGHINKATYIAFLTQAFHHVKHTVPLLMACGGKLSAEFEWLRTAIAEYITEELGHHEWILNDLEACGVDKEDVRQSTPGIAMDLMVSYLYHTIDRGNPLGFFGMVHVLEGTSVQLACSMADTIQQRLELPDKAFTYLRSHGELDQGHIKFFESLMDKIDDSVHQEAIIQSSKTCYQLYGDMLRALPLPIAQQQAAA